MRFLEVGQDDPLAAPMLDDLQREYESRYGSLAGTEYEDLRAYDAAEFAPPGGVLIVGTVDGEAAAGGAFRRYDDTTAELKRIWTAAGHRRRGYAALVVAELEHIAAQRGYQRVYLTTGPRQPEAVALYLAAGYTPLYDVSRAPAEIGVHPFEKSLPIT